MCTRLLSHSLTHFASFYAFTSPPVVQCHTVRRILSTLGLGFSLLFVFAPLAWASPIFIDQVERFEVTGNLPGSFVDEFDDGVVAPWSADAGTVSESGGLLNLSSPGDFSDLFQLLNPIIDLHSSFVGSPVVVSDGSGNFVVESTWVTVSPPSGTGAMVFGNEDFTIGLQISHPTADLLVSPFTFDPGLQIQFVNSIPDPIRAEHVDSGAAGFPI